MEASYRAIYRAAFDLHKKYCRALTPDEWDALNSELMRAAALFDCQFAYDLLCAVHDEIERISSRSPPS